MKKLLIALLVVVGVCVIGVVGVGYYVYTKAKPYVGQATAIVKQAEQLGALDKSVEESGFTPPANGELTEAMMTRFASVQESMVSSLGPTVDQMKAREDEFQKRQNDEHREATPGENFTVVTDLMKFILQGKTVQVQALNRAKFSLDEYSWVRSRVYAAAGMSIAGINLTGLADATAAGNLTKPISSAGEDVPERNKTLVAPYLPKLKDWAVFAFFGL